MVSQPKKKILFIITQSEFGGAQRFLVELATHLDREKYECVVASRPGELFDILAARHIATRPLKWLLRDISPVRDLLAPWEIKKLLKREEPDTLFLLSSKAGFLGSLAARLFLYTYTLVYRCRVIYRIGGWAFNDPQSWFSRKLYTAAEKISARWKDVIIVNSEHDRLQAEQLGIRPREKLVTIYNGISPDSINFLSRDEAREKLNAILSYKLKAKSYKLVGCIANFYKTKGVSYFIEAAVHIHKTNPQVRFIIMGDGLEREDLETRIIKHEARDYVFLAGRVAQAWKYLKAFDIFVLPSLKEGFPWVLLETMAAEVPVVAARVGAIPEIIESGKSGLVVEPGDTKALSVAIEKLLADENLRRSFAAHAKEAVMQKFPLGKMLEEIEKTL